MKTKRAPRIHDPSTLEDRRTMARACLRAGDSNPTIRARLQEKYGAGIGTPWLNKERKIINTQRGMATAEVATGVAEAKGYVPEVVATADARIVAALLAAKVPFTFDGKCIKLSLPESGAPF